MTKILDFFLSYFENIIQTGLNFTSSQSMKNIACVGQKKKKVPS